MEKHYFFYGSQVEEFERPRISDVVYTHGLKGSMEAKIYKLIIRQGGENMFVIKQNDTLPNLEIQLLDYDSNPLNLELCGIKFHMTDRKGLVKIDRPAEIINVETGDIKVNWLEGDTSETGIFKGEFEVNMPDGKVVTIPNDGYFTINIIKELA